jgi:DNA-directed RNA polymerase subunit RPC12/RpoP
MAAEPAMPDDDTLTSVIAEFEALGFTGQFRAEPDAVVHCFTCGKEFPATQIDASDVRRLEGVSDPADMLLVAPVVCPHCGAPGTLTLNYGPESTLEDAEVLLAFERTPTATPPPST